MTTVVPVRRRRRGPRKPLSEMTQYMRARGWRPWQRLRGAYVPILGWKRRRQ